jgi:thiol-disulfide isomerase/thioredoxin
MKKRLLFSLVTTLFGSSLILAARHSPMQAKSVDKKAYKEIASMNDFHAIINSTKPTVIKFYAPWCGACTAMDELFNSAARTYQDTAQFCNLDVTKDELKDVIDIFGIQATPTLIYKEIGFKDKDEFNKRLESFLIKPKPASSKKAEPKDPPTASEKTSKAKGSKPAANTKKKQSKPLTKRQPAKKSRSVS